MSDFLTGNVDVVNPSPIPVTGTVTTSNPGLTDAQLRAIPVPVSGTIAVSNFPATQNVDVINTVPVTGTFFQATQPVSLASTTITNFPASQVVTLASTTITGSVAVTGAFFQATQPVSGTVTALQGTSPWVVSGSITTSPNVNVHDGSGNTITSTGTSLNVDVTNTVPVTGTFFQTTQPVSLTSTTITGNVTVVQPTGTSLHVVVDSAPSTVVTQGTSPWVTSLASTTITGNVTVVQPTGSNLNVAVSNFPATVAVTQSTSPWVVSGTVTANAGTGNFTVVQPTGTNLHVVVDSAPSTVVTQGTSPWVTSLASTTVTGNVTVIQPTGTNLHTVIDSGTLTTVSTVTAVTSITNALPAGTNVIGHVITDTGSTTVVTGTVAENLIQVAGVTLGATAVTSYGTAPAAANVPGVNAFITNTPAVTLASTTITGNVTVVQPTGTNLHVVNDASSAVIGHVITDTGSTTAVTGNVTVVQPTGTSLHTVVDNFPADTDAVAIGSTTSGQLGSLSMGAVTTAAPTYVTAQTNPLSLTTAGALRVDGSGVTQPVSLTSTTITGTVTVAGNRTNNNAVPGATNEGVLPALANASNPTWTEGNLVLLSEDLTGNLRVKQPFLTGADTFTVAANGTTLDAHLTPVKSFSIQVKGTGATATSWIIVLEGSLDNVNFTTLLQHMTSDGDGKILSSGASLFPVLYFRSRLVQVVLGSATNVVVTILGVI
jgi:hypothetical protein